MNDTWMTEDDRLLAEAADGVAAEVAQAPPAAVWSILAAQGWPGLRVEADLGGFEGSDKAMMILARALGLAGARTPFIWSVAMPAALLDAGAAEPRRAWRSALAAGERRFAVALHESAADPEGDVVETRARSTGDGWHVTGAKLAAPYVEGADQLIVSARVGSADEGEVGLFMIPTDAPGVALRHLSLIDGTPVSEVSFRETPIEAGARLDEDGARVRVAIAEALRLGVVAAVAESLGGLERALAQSVDHLKTRRQFGAPLASLQVLRHRIADMYIATEELRSLALAACGADLDAARAAKVYLGEAGVWVAEQAVQLHGAMGVTEECDVGQILKRIIVLDRLLGGADHHLSRLGDGLRPDARPGSAVG